MPADRTGSGEEKWKVRPALATVSGIERLLQRVYHVYDPRLTVIDEVVYAAFAADTDEGCRLGIARSRDLESFELISFDESGDRRNGVLFPERVGGQYLRLERPNSDVQPGGPASGAEIMLAESNDLVTWRPVAAVMAGRPRYWDELIGSGPPPVKTGEGWLHLYHGVATHFASTNIYQVGAVLLDLRDPSRVVARTRLNLLEPREPYELTGQVPNVVFPSGMIVEKTDDKGIALPDSPVRIYYGAADTCVAVATTTIRELLQQCESVA
jgi:beta-1,4-mannooligosaccharide/beta-1,4-mannosyl-N-acetylglucosamine phosphorylase